MKKYDLPTDLVEQRDLIRWVQNHPVWYAPVPRHQKNETEFAKKALGNLTHLPHMGWECCVDIDTAFVNPATKEIDDDDSLNTHFEVWIEAGPPVDISNEGMAPPPGGWDRWNRYARSHDFNLDCGGDTLKEALMKLTILVKENYGDYSQEANGWLLWHKTSPFGLLYGEE